MAVVKFFKLDDNIASPDANALRIFETISNTHAVFSGETGTAVRHTTDVPAGGGPVVASLDFDGNNDYVDFTSFTLGADVGWSISCWVKCDTSGVAWIAGRSNTGSHVLANGTSFTVRINANNYIFTISSIGTNWTHVLVCHSAANDVRISINGGDTPTTHNSGANAQAIAFFGRAGASYHDGHLAYCRLYDSDEYANRAAIYAADSEPTDSILVTLPENYQTIPRNTATTGEIPYELEYTGNPTSISAQWGNRAPVVVDASPSGGTSSGTLPPMPKGQADLTFYFTNDEDVSYTVTKVGIGRVMPLLWQSNASGRLTNNQVYTPAPFDLTILANDDTWKPGVDPIDSAVGGTAANDVSDDGTAAGNLFVIFARLYINYYREPLAFIPCAKGNTSAADWQRPVVGEDTTTLYGSAGRRILMASSTPVVGMNCALAHGGETDANLGTLAITFGSQVGAWADDMFADYGIKLLLCKIHNTGDDCNEVWTALDSLNATNENLAVIADFSDIDYSGRPDVYHPVSDADGLEFATRWFNGFKASSFGGYLGGEESQVILFSA